MQFVVGQRVSTDRGPATVAYPTSQLTLVTLERPAGLQVALQTSSLRPLGKAPANGTATAKGSATSSPAVAGGNGRVPSPAGSPVATGQPPASANAASGNGLANESAPLGPTRVMSPARQALEALRFGLVPESRLEQLTIGFDTLSGWVTERLPKSQKGRPTVSEVCGPFGTGKSHTMAVVRHLARKSGYLTAHVEVDGRTISLSDPARLLYGLWSTLSGDGLSAATPVLDLFCRALDASALTPRVAPVGIDRTHDNFAGVKVLKRRNLLDAHGDAVDALLSSSDEVTAHEVNRAVWAEPTVATSDVLFKPIIGQLVKDRPVDFVESLVGMTTVAEQAGFAGLVITIDEFEVEHSHLTRAQMQRVESLISVLTDYLEGHLRHRVAPLSLFFATVGQAGHRGDEVVDEMLERADGDWYELRALNRADRARLAGRIHKLYQEAHGSIGPLDEDLVRTVESEMDVHGLDDSGVTRAFIKRFVAALDSVHGPGAV